MTTELVHVVTGEVIEAMTEAEADEVTELIRSDLEDLVDVVDRVMSRIKPALTRGVWMVRGYRSPGEYLMQEFDGAFGQLPADARRGVVSALALSGMSVRAIAPVVGVSKSTVADDLSTVQNRTVEDDHGPAPVIGINGKRYERPAPKPMPPPLPPEDTPELRQRDSRALLRRVVDMVALDGRALDPDAWARQIGDMDDELADLIARAELSGRVLLDLADRKRS